MPVNDKKRAYAAKLESLIEAHSNILIVSCDNVGSKQLQQIRIALRGRATLLFGKNTTIRKVLREFARKNPGHPANQLLELINGNMGFVFTNEDVGAIREAILSNTVPAPAKVGGLAPSDVFVEPGPTGCDPGQTAWFQALNIPTKINRGQIEMIARVHLIQAGSKVGESQAALLTKLGVKPFSYSLLVPTVYQNGDIFDAKVLDITEADMVAKLLSGAKAIAALGLAVGFPTKASLVHSLNNAFKAVLSISLGTDYETELSKEFAKFIPDLAPAAEESEE